MMVCDELNRLFVKDSTVKGFVRNVFFNLNEVECSVVSGVLCSVFC